MLRIKELRTEHRLTQKEFAEKINSTDKNIWAYENNVAVPPLDVLTRMANFFECSVDYLVGREDDFGNVIIKAEKTANLPANEEKLLRNFRKLPSDLQHRASGYVEKLVSVIEEESVSVFPKSNTLPSSTSHKA